MIEKILDWYKQRKAKRDYAKRIARLKKQCKELYGDEYIKYLVLTKITLERNWAGGLEEGKTFEESLLEYMIGVYVVRKVTVGVGLVESY